MGDQGKRYNKERERVCNGEYNENRQSENKPSELGWSLTCLNPLLCSFAPDPGKRHVEHWSIMGGYWLQCPTVVPWDGFQEDARSDPDVSDADEELPHDME